jgi:hypothetical protein
MALASPCAPGLLFLELLAVAIRFASYGDTRRERAWQCAALMEQTPPLTV